MKNVHYSCEAFEKQHWRLITVIHSENCIGLVLPSQELNSSLLPVSAAANQKQNWHFLEQHSLNPIFIYLFFKSQGKHEDPAEITQTALFPAINVRAEGVGPEAWG